MKTNTQMKKLEKAQMQKIKGGNYWAFLDWYWRFAKKATDNATNYI